MKLIVGLGNPGTKYETTRHNIGFLAVDLFAKNLNADFKEWGQKKNSSLVKIGNGDDSFLIQKPLTFMNLSGEAVVAAAYFFKILPEDICILHDEVDVEFGLIRLKVGGGDGGHNGLKSITKSLGSSGYSRIRIGVGRPPHPSMDTADFVLSSFANADWPTVEDMLERSITGIKAFLEGPDHFLRQMNQLNRKK